MTEFTTENRGERGRTEGLAGRASRGWLTRNHKRKLRMDSSFACVWGSHVNGAPAGAGARQPRTVLASVRLRFFFVPPL